MNSRPRLQGSSRRISFWLNAALLFVILIDVCVLALKLANSAESCFYLSLAEFMRIPSMLLLVVVLVVRYIYNKSLRQRAAAGERQLDAMLSMLASVKHDLNNDMQVVIGNAELAGMMIENRGDVSQPVGKIMSAAAMAIERIEQLAVFSPDNYTEPSAIDLNSALRECATKLSVEMPAGVMLHLELAHMPIRVIADRYLLSLSLSHLIRQVVKTIDYGGEIEIRSRDVPHEAKIHGTGGVCVDVSVVRKPNSNGSSTDAQNRLLDVRMLKTAIDTTEALLERSGAVAFKHSLAPEKSLISMEFRT